MDFQEERENEMYEKGYEMMQIKIVKLLNRRIISRENNIRHFKNKQVNIKKKRSIQKMIIQIALLKQIKREVDKL